MLLLNGPPTTTTRVTCFTNDQHRLMMQWRLHTCVHTFICYLFSSAQTHDTHQSYFFFNPNRCESQSSSTSQYLHSLYVMCIAFIIFKIYLFFQFYCVFCFILSLYHSLMNFTLAAAGTSKEWHYYSRISSYLILSC